MVCSLAEEALGRVLAYLRGTGMETSPGVTRRVLQLIEQSLDEEHAERLLETVMQQLPTVFELPAEALPVVTAPLCRGSLHYADSL